MARSRDRPTRRTTGGHLLRGRDPGRDSSLLVRHRPGERAAVQVHATALEALRRARALMDEQVDAPLARGGGW